MRAVDKSELIDLSVVVFAAKGCEGAKRCAHSMASLRLRRRIVGTNLVAESSGRWLTLISRGIDWTRIVLLGDLVVILKAELGSLVRDENMETTSSLSWFVVFELWEDYFPEDCPNGWG